MSTATATIDAAHRCPKCGGDGGTTYCPHCFPAKFNLPHAAAAEPATRAGATARPWRTGSQRNSIWKDDNLVIPKHIATCEPGLNAISREECDANAELIVRCVNSHDTLVHALQMAEKAWALTLANRQGCEPEDVREPILNAMRAALSLAEGEAGK